MCKMVKEGYKGTQLDAPVFCNLRAVGVCPCIEYILRTKVLIPPVIEDIEDFFWSRAILAGP